MTLQAKIHEALCDYAKIVNESKRIKSEVAKAFVFAAAQDAANRLLHIAKTIRQNVHLRQWNEHGRVPSEITDDMLAWGATTGFLSFSV